MQLPQEFLARLRTQLGETGFLEYCNAMETPPKRGLRVNSLKAETEAFFAASPFRLERVAEIPEGFLLKEAVPGIGSHPYHRAGLFYLQEPSAMGPVHALDPKPKMRVLDLCAAPGGKSGQIAARLNGEGLLIANEIVPNRAQTLSRTLERLGVRNAMVTSMKPDVLCKAVEGQMDQVLVDAPCSGEGMFRKDEQAIAEWSPAHVSACAVRQLNILESAALAVKPGGRLVYSTCTFSPEENEGTVEAFTKAQNGAFRVVDMQRRWPHTSQGEGHFYAVLEKAEDTGERPQGYMAPPAPNKREAKELAAYEAFVKTEMTAVPYGQPTLLPDGRVQLLPYELPKGYDRLRIIRLGVQAGEVKNGRFLPDHCLYMAYPGEAFRNTVTLNEQQMNVYLGGNVVEVEETLKSWCAVLPEGCRWPVGFGKAVNGTLKNHLPKGLR